MITFFPSELLQRRSSQVNMFPCVQKPPRYDFGGDDDFDENDDHDAAASSPCSAEGEAGAGGGTKVSEGVQE